MAVYVRVKKPNGLIYTMDIEEYVRGVVPRETPASWHPEALKAQAIAARTYALANRKHRAAGYDVCSTTCCQVYSDARDSRTNAAVAATRGIVGCARGTRELRSTYFSARCGGHTSNSWGPEWLRYTDCICYPPRFGHGQGYCQVGGHRYGLRGWRAKAILDHYYNLDWRHDYGQGGIWDGSDVGTVAPSPQPLPQPLPQPPPEPPTPTLPEPLDEDSLFDDAVNYLWELHTLLWQWADKVSGVWLIGQYFEALLDNASQGLRNVCFKLWNFRVVVLRALRYINQVLDGTLIAAVMEKLLWNFDLLRRDPGAWVAAHIRYMFPAWDSFIRDPDGFIAARASAAMKQALDMLREPGAWLTAQINALWPAVVAFGRDPDGYIRGTLRVLWPDGYAVLQNPRQAVAGIVEVTLWPLLESAGERLASLAERIISERWDKWG
jgi:hypothetical protein